MKQMHWLRVCGATLLPLMLLAAACSTQPAEPPSVAVLPKLPPLPAQAQQGECQRICQTLTGSCSCSGALMELRESLRLRLDQPVPLGKPASEPTKQQGKP